jgi:hypothetical protein
LKLLAKLLQIVVGFFIAILAPIVTLWLAAPLSQGCAVTWSPWNIFSSPSYCSFTLTPLVIALTLPTFALGGVACLRRAWPLGITIIVVGLLAWLFLIPSLVLQTIV